jgi:transposase
MLIHHDRRSIMGKPLSLDLRQRVVTRVEAGHSRRAAAAHFGISESCAVKLMQRVEATGSPAPARQGRPPGTGKLAPYRDFLIARVRAKPDIAMPELAAVLREVHGVKAAPAALSRMLCKAGYSYKKSADGGRARAPRRR